MSCRSGSAAALAVNAKLARPPVREENSVKRKPGNTFLPTTSRDAVPAEVPDAYIVPQDALATLAPNLNRLESEFEERAIGDRSVQEGYRAAVCSLLGDVGQSILKYVDGRLRQAPH